VTEKSEAIAFTRRCQSSQLTRRWTQKEQSEKWRAKEEERHKKSKVLTYIFGAISKVSSGLHTTKHLLEI
jgi:hypothetical protein